MVAARHQPRRGLTLMEVLVSLAIFLFALVAIGQLLNFGTDRALEARYTQQAAFLCQSKLNELSVGSIALQSAGEDRFDDGGVTWNWTVDCNQGDVSGLWTVKVSVYKDSGFGQQIKVTMSKMILDPANRGSTGDSPPPSKYATSSSDSSSCSSGSSSSGG